MLETRATAGRWRGMEEIDRVCGLKEKVLQWRLAIVHLIMCFVIWM